MIFPDSITLHYYDGTQWVDIYSYVLHRSGGVSGSWGMGGNRHTDRLARAGTMRVVLDNTDGKFDPDDTDCLTGWAVNTNVKLTATYDSFSKIAFYGHVTDIQLNDPEYGDHTARITVNDWMDYAYRFTITQQSIETYKRGDQVAKTIVNAVGHTPQATEYNEGDNEFEAAFDSMTVKTKAATELNKIVLSEGGYFYNRHDRTYGEKLVFEAGSTRNSARAVAKIPKLVADCGYLLMANSATDHVLMANSATDKIILNDAQDAHINGVAQRYERSHGENIINKVTVTVYPKRTDSTEQTLYSLGEVIRISSGETKTINVRYQNADTKESCNAITSLMVDPVATTDYTMNTKKDGSGTDLTSDLTVTVVFRTAEAEITLTNASTYTGRITKLQLRGYGVYQDSSIQYVIDNENSIDSYGTHELNIEQQYQRDTVMGETMANKIVYTEKNPRTRLEKVTMIANVASVLMFAFLAVDVGDLVKITESGLGIDDNYYIQGIDFSITEGNIITYSWTLIDEELQEIQYEDVSIDFDNSYAQRIVFNNDIDALQSKTIMFDYNMTSFGDTSFVQWVVSRHPSWYVQIATSSERINFLNEFSGENGIWVTDNNSFSTGLHNVAITMDGSSASNNPIIYLDGSSINVTELTAPAGNVDNDDGAAIQIGAVGTADRAPNGNIKYVKIWNRILSSDDIAAEVATPGSITDGLVFSGPAIVDDMTAYYDDLALSISDKLFDTVSESVGSASGSPTSQLIP